MGAVVNTSLEVLPIAARTAETASSVFRNRHHRGVRVHFNCTLDPGTAAVVATVQGKDTITGEYYTLLASASIAATGDTYLLVYPGAAVTSNVSVNQPLPPYWRVLVTVNDTESLTYGITAELLK